MTKEHLNKIIALKRNGDNSIFWDKGFVENVARHYFPDLYQIMKEQLRIEQPSYTTEAITIQTEGNEEKTFSVSAYHSVYGYKLWTFFTRMYWEWNEAGDKITSVSPTTWGEAYDPTWHYDGIIAEGGRYEYDGYRYYKWVKGYFYMSEPLSGQKLQNRYPWLDIWVYAGGANAYDSGID
ncbi:MAG: hypothetical protein H0Z35_10610 [Thermoanaerobacteraceae bacterium]|nr:hypothetical protein [Thermoanaerobacteraceae bacterium]